MKVSILCSSSNHPIYAGLQRWRESHLHEHDIELITRRDLLSGGDLLFLISCNEIVGRNIRSMYKANLVIHASNLPQGRGWSPHIWQVLAGKNKITVSLLEAEDGVDTGAIWAQECFELQGHELYDEINQALFSVELSLMDFAVENFSLVQPRLQSSEGISYCRKRRPADSRIDPNKSIAEQFELLRVADPNRYPAFFDFRGYRYQISLIKQGRVENETEVS